MEELYSLDLDSLAQLRSKISLNPKWSMFRVHIWAVCPYLNLD